MPDHNKIILRLYPAATAIKVSGDLRNPCPQNAL